MGGRGSNSQIATPAITPTAMAAQAANNARFSDTDNSPFHDLYGGRQYYQDQTFGIDTRMALQDYLHDQAAQGTMYSPSQLLNGKLRTGQPLTANEQFMYDAMMDGMHNLGYNINLTRYDRVDFLQRLGFGPGYQNMTPAQLQKTFVGMTYTDQAFVSTSYNNFKNAPPNNVFTDKAVRINIKAPARTQGLMPGNGPGGALGEIVLAPGQSYRITGVRFTGKTGRSGGSSYKQIEFDVEVV